MLLDTVSEWIVFGLLSIFTTSGNHTDIQCSKNQLYYNAIGRCYDYNKTHPPQGPCRMGLVFLPEVDSPTVGQCICPESSKSNRTFVYHKTSQRCYGILTRGPCTEKKWIDIDLSRGPLCNRNPCSKSRDHVTFNGKCVKLGDHCDLPGPGKSNGTVSFVHGSLYPVCLEVPGIMGLRAIGAVRSTCAKGTYRTPDGQNCVAPISFDF